MLQGKRVLPLHWGQRGEQAAPFHTSALCSLLKADAVSPVQPLSLALRRGGRRSSPAPGQLPWLRSEDLHRLSPPRTSVGCFPRGAGGGRIRAIASTRLLSRSPDSLPNSILLHLQALPWLLSGEPAPGGSPPPAPIALFCSSSPARVCPPPRQSPFPLRRALSLGDCRLPGEVTGGEGRPSPWRRAGRAAVHGALGWGPDPGTVGGGPHSPAVRSGAERSCCLCVAAACGAPRGAQRPLTSGSAGSKKVGF